MERSSAAAGVVDPQALRLRRFLMAAGTALLMPLLLLIAALLGMVSVRVVGQGFALILGVSALFYLLIRSGLNRRFRDPSMTGELILAAILSTAYISYIAGEARPAIAMFYLVAMLFGALRLGAVRLLGLALIALLAHSTVLRAWYGQNPGASSTAALMELVALALLLPWSALMGGYVNGLRARLADSNRRLQQAVARIEEIAIRDELTGVYNRRFIMESLAREHARAKRLGATYSVCMLDVDHFKRINDSLGHGAGDAVLKQLVHVAGAGLRASDVFGRYGGEEFLLLLPDTTLEGARTAGERVRGNIAAAVFEGVPSGSQVTLTVGIACLVAGEEIQAVMARADRGLYAGKAAGRNRVAAVG
jgi:diguanylate cyclase